MLCVLVCRSSLHPATSRRQRRNAAPTQPPPRLHTAPANLSHPPTHQNQVAEHVKARFCNDDWMAAQLDKTVNEIVVVYVDTKEVHNSRPSPDHEYAPIPSHRA